MSILSLPSIPQFRPMFNIGGGLDIPTGTYHLGRYGESILNSGLGHILSLAGPPNSFKSAIILFIHLSIAEHIEQFQLSIYDTEGSLTYDRINLLCNKFENLRLINHGSDLLNPSNVKVVITSSSDIMGDIYFEEILKIADNKMASKTPKLTTPFLSDSGRPINIISPTGAIIDTLSEFDVTNVQESIVDKNNIGDSGNNTIYMRRGLAKKQLISQLPNMCVNSGLYFSMTSHVGEEFEMAGPMAPKKHRLTHAKKGSKYIGVSPSFKAINNALYEIMDASLLNNKEYNTGVLYPKSEADRKPGCVDLLIIRLTLTRNKGGPSGAKVDLIVSQEEGVLPHLSQFHYIKEFDRFGLIGNNSNYSLALLPEVKLSRTTVRGIIDENSKLRRALEITSELLQIKYLWPNLPDDLMCTPQELYEDIKNKGYDWDVLLNTRGYWVFTESENKYLPYLSTMCLLRMRKNLYTPYFLNPDYIKTTKGFLYEILSAIK